MPQVKRDGPLLAFGGRRAGSPSLPYSSGRFRLPGLAGCLGGLPGPAGWLPLSGGTSPRDVQILALRIGCKGWARRAYHILPCPAGRPAGRPSRCPGCLAATAVWRTRLAGGPIVCSTRAGPALPPLLPSCFFSICCLCLLLIILFALPRLLPSVATEPGACEGSRPWTAPATKRTKHASANGGEKGITPETNGTIPDYTIL